MSNQLVLATNPVAFTVTTNLVTGTGMSGNWTVRAFALRLNNQTNQATSTSAQFGHPGTYPNLLDAAAAESFVTLTHEQYAQRFGPLQGKIDAFYANEPNLMTLWWSVDPAARPGGVSFLPWSTNLPARFQQDHGYSLLPWLPALYEGTDVVAKRVRRHFYKTVGNMLTENFSQRIGNWATSQGILAAGHPLQEEDLYYHVIHSGDLFRFVEPMQVPACDLPMPDRGADWNYWMPKFLSSVGQFKNRTTVAGLLDPTIYRPFFDLTPLPDHFRRIVNMAVLAGVNQFQTYLYWNQYPSALYRGMNEYVGRLTQILRGARNAATVGIYYPIETFQANFRPVPEFWGEPIVPWHDMRTWMNDLNDTAMYLAQAGMDFNWLHGDWIRDATLEGGRLVIGSHRYSAIVLPRTQILPLAVANKLEQFEQAGGKIVLVGSLPTMGDAASEDAAVTAKFAGRTTYLGSEVPGQIGTVQPPDFVVSVTAPAQTGTEQEFFHARFLRDGRRIHYLVNNSAAAVTPSLSLTNTNAATLSVAVYNPLDGTVTSRALPNTLKIVPFSSLLVVENPAAMPGQSYSISAPALAVVNGNFSDLLGTNRISTEWFSGSPAGWANGVSGTYAIATLNGTAYANLQVLTPGGESNSLRQSVGTNLVTSDLRLQFSLTNFTASSSSVGVAMYGSGGVNLGSTNVTGPGTYTHTVRNVAPGTPIQIAFWGTPGAAAMGLSGVSISSSNSTGDLSVAAGGVLELNTASPSSISGNLNLGAGSKIRVAGTPSGSAVLLLEAAGTISGTPVLDPAVAGYTLKSTENLIWLRADTLSLVNGSFSDGAGMAAGANSEWKNGLPIGWSTDTSTSRSAPTYSLYNGNGTLSVANLSQLGPASPFKPFYQTLGRAGMVGTVTVNFEIRNDWNPGSAIGVGAAIYQVGTGSVGGWPTLATATLNASGTHTLQARVSKDTSLAIGFWNFGAASAGLDNVTLSFVPDPPSGLIYSPSSVIATAGSAISPWGPPALTGTATNFSILPLLPAGLSIDSATGVISGTPGFPNPSTVHTVTASNPAGSTTTTVTLTVRSIFQSWAANYGLDPATNGASGADPDGDSLSNAVEYAFGTSPVSGAGEVVESSASGGLFTIQWLQRTDGAATYTVQETASLSSSWTSSASVVQAGSGSTPPTGYEWKKITVPATDRKFYRVNAVLSP